MNIELHEKLINLIERKIQLVNSARKVFLYDTFSFDYESDYGVPYCTKHVYLWYDDKMYNGLVITDDNGGVMCLFDYIKSFDLLPDAKERLLQYNYMISEINKMIEKIKNDIENLEKGGIKQFLTEGREDD